MSMETTRPQTLGKINRWEHTNARAARAESALNAVFRLLDAQEDDEAEHLLDLISDKAHSQGPRGQILSLDAAEDRLIAHFKAHGWAMTRDPA